MKKGQVYEGSVVRVDFPNKGIVCVGDETAVVKNSLPGQKVKFSVNKVRKGKAEGRLFGGDGKVTSGNRPDVFPFWVVRRMYLSVSSLRRTAESQGGTGKRLLDSVLNKQEEAWAFEGIKGSPEGL